MAQMIGKVRSTRKNQKVAVNGDEIGGNGRDGRHWYDVTLHDDGTVRCSCPHWKFQRLSPSARSCKHLVQFAAARRSGVTRNVDVIVYDGR